jgi:hypothetical protein
MANVPNVGTESGFMSRLNDGVQKAKLTSMRLMADVTSFIFSSSEGIQMQPPTLKVINISRIHPSNVYDESWSTRLAEVMPRKLDNCFAVEEHEACSMTQPFGFPVLPDVKITVQKLA